MWDKSLLKVSSYKELTYQNVAEKIIQAIWSDPMLADDIAILDYIRPSCSEPESIIPSVLDSSCTIAEGDSEGWYLDLNIDPLHILTAKTLEEGPEAGYALGKIAGALSYALQQLINENWKLFPDSLW